jgi:hypothetical protein
VGFISFFSLCRILLYGPELPEIAECDSDKAETARKDDTPPMSLLVNNSAASSLTQFTLSHRERKALAGALIPRQEAPVEASLFFRTTSRH